MVFFFQAEDGIRDTSVTGVQTCALPISIGPNGSVKADVIAREVIVRGKIEGKVTGRDRVQLWSTGQVTGEVRSEERRVGKEGRSRWWQYHKKKKIETNRVGGGQKFRYQ